jgi:hypothetical protein
VDSNAKLHLNAHAHRWRYIAVDAIDSAPEVGLLATLACVAVFDHPEGGLVWVEPHYIEGPAGGRPAGHAQRGRLRWSRDQGTLSGGNTTIVLREPAGEDEQWIIRAIDAWQAIAHDQHGRSRSEERAWLANEMRREPLAP